MQPPRANYGWNPIESAPLDEDIALQVTDGRGAPYTLQHAHFGLALAGHQFGVAKRPLAGIERFPHQRHSYEIVGVSGCP
jgi:hypothetical protein